MISRKRKPVDVKGPDQEQIELGASDKFWKLISKRRKQKTLSRRALARRINSEKSISAK